MRINRKKWRKINFTRFSALFCALLVISAFLPATVCAEDVCVEGADCVGKSYPRFWEDFNALWGGEA